MSLPQFRDFEVEQVVGCRLFLNARSATHWVPESLSYDESVNPREGLRYVNLCYSGNDNQKIEVVSGFPQDFRVIAISRIEHSDVLFITAESLADKKTRLLSWDSKAKDSAFQVLYQGNDIVKVVPLGHTAWVVTKDDKKENDPYELLALDLSTHQVKSVTRFRIESDPNNSSDPIHIIATSDDETAWVWLEGSRANQNFAPWGYQLLLASTTGQIKYKLAKSSNKLGIKVFERQRAREQREMNATHPDQVVSTSPADHLWVATFGGPESSTGLSWISDHGERIPWSQLDNPQVEFTAESIWVIGRVKGGGYYLFRRPIKKSPFSKSDVESDDHASRLQTVDQGTKLFPDDTDAVWLVARGIGVSRVDASGEARHWSGALWSMIQEVGLVPCGNRRAWVTPKDKGPLLLGDDESLGIQYLEMNGIPVDPKADGRIPIASQAPEVGVNMSLVWPGAAEGQGQVEVVLQEARTVGKTAFVPVDGAAVSQTYKKNLSFVIHPSGKINVTGTVYRAFIHYTDSYGSDFSIITSNLRFKNDSGQVAIRTTIAFLGLLGLAAAFSTFQRGRQRISLIRWMPFLLFLVGGSSPLYGRVLEQAGIDPLLLSFLVAFSLVALMFVGTLSPATFRLLVQTPPFSLLAAPACSQPRVRRMLLADHALQVRSRIKGERLEANRETYVELPARLSGSMLPEEEYVVQPPGRLTQLIDADGTRVVSVLIEAPGGRGKTALLRELTLAFVDRWQCKATEVHPIIVQGNQGDLISQALDTLERYLGSRELAKMEIQSGRYVLLLDGLTESSIPSQALRDVLHGEGGFRVSLIATGRPHAGNRNAIKSAENYFIVEPLPLTDALLPAFEQAYRLIDSKFFHMEVPPLSREVLEACQSDDGTYQPILLRLAVLVAADGVTSVADIYRMTLRRLCSRDTQETELVGDEVIEKAASLCRETYWKDGNRRFPFQDAPSEQKRLMELLYRVGILVAVGAAKNSGILSIKNLSFFHDSMQSFLTAIGLYQKPPDADWGFLLRAAGCPLFINEQVGGVQISRSELFSMCLEVFQPPSRVRARLTQELSSWAVSYKRMLSVDVISRSKSSLVADNAGWSDSPPSDVLLSVIGESKRLDEKRGDSHCLGNLYAALAPLVWEWQERTSSQTLDSAAASE